MHGLSCTGIGKRYGGLVVLNDVALHVEDGEVLGIAGPNGAGKTTLLDVLSGRVRSEAGVVELNGRDVTRASAAKRARQGLARTFQAPLVPVQLSVGEALAAARLAWSPPASRGDSARVRELVDFRPADDVRCGALSTLDRRKLLLVCLLIRAPSVLLLDEPCSGLLEDEIGEIDRIIVSLVAAGGLAVVVVEHRLELLFSIAGRVVVLDEGREIAHGPPAEVFAAPAVREAYFEAEPAAAQQ